MAETETETETNEAVLAKALATQLFYLRAIFVAVLAVAVMVVATAWTAIDVGAATATTTPAATSTSRIAYANDGSGDYWTLNAAGDFCPLCGPSRGGPMSFADDVRGVTASAVGPLGQAVVTATSWPVAPAAITTKVVRAGTGRTIGGAFTTVAVGYVVVNPETGAVGGGGLAADAEGISWSVATALTGQRVGSRLLIAVPGSGSAKPDLYLLDVTGSTTLPPCAGGSHVNCVSSGGSGNMERTGVPKVGTAVGDVSVVYGGGGGGSGYAPVPPDINTAARAMADALDSAITGYGGTGQVYTGTMAPVAR